MFDKTIRLRDLIFWLLMIAEFSIGTALLNLGTYASTIAGAIVYYACGLLVGIKIAHRHSS